MTDLRRGAVERFRSLLLQSGSAAIGIVALLLLWAGLLHTLQAAHHAAIANARSQTANLARAFEEQIVRSIKAVDQSLMFVRENYARDPAAFAIASWARSAAAVTDVAIQLTLVDRHGIVRASSLTPTPDPVDLTDREHIRVQLDSPGDELFISKPVVGRVSNVWSIQFTRKLFTADGQFAGVAVISLDPTYLTRFYRSIDLGEFGAVTLIGTDGTVRAAARVTASPQTDMAIGKSVPATALLPGNAGTETATVGPVDYDGVSRVTTYRPVRDYPLSVAVGVGEAEILEEFWAMRRTDLSVALVLTLLLAAATIAVVVHQRRLFVIRRQLRESERLHAEKSALLETALEHMNQGILMIDGQRRIQVCNRRARSMLDLPFEVTKQGALFDDMLRYQWQQGEFGPAGARLEPEVLAFLHRGGLSDTPHAYERKRPTGAVLEVRSMPLAEGGVVRTFTDITARKQIEEDLRTARDQADVATRAKSEFLATMSHEIRLPLSGLVGAIDLLRTTALTPDQAHMAGLAHSSALTLLAILNDILDWSKIEAGALTLCVEPVDLRTLLCEIAEPHAIIAARADVGLTMHVDPTVPELVRTDRLRLGQIVTNLLSNAVKFTPHGRIKLVVAVERAGGTLSLRVDVRDTGCGMDPSLLSRLFQPFTQGDGSNARAANGTGLGLCISRRLAELMQGTLSVVSAPGCGSCFSLIVPCIADDGAGEAELPGDLADGTANALAGLRVLVVDDHATNLWLTKRQLGILGAFVETAATGPAALDKLRDSRFDLLLTDCHMESMDGVALTQAIRRSPHQWGAIPIVGLTADVSPEQAGRCRAAGMDDVLYKPVQRARLAQLLGRHFVPSARQQPAALPPAFDATTFHDLFEPGNPGGVAWLRSFCTSAAVQANALRRLFDTEPLDRAGLVGIAHAMVGASLAVGATRLASAASTLEHAAGSEPGASLALMFGAIDIEASHAFAAIEIFLQAQSSLPGRSPPQLSVLAPPGPGRS